ncbi:dynein regulatory complex protein 9 isoform X2 [Scleropages formosus]|uniref:dynein regulatory complex protein 9 isoform X2 n=1 Tax=Scleropages formosus TaxID=113540 RepID=UPI000877F4DE|nr:dynein regulatory complex protein 9 isoform X2 [Scleropages formosus]
MSSPWPREQQLRLSTVLMDCVEQLTALGRIMLHSGRACPAAGPPSEIVTVDVGEMQVQVKVLCPAEGEGAKPKDCPPSPEKLVKVQRDRQFVAQVISDVAEELRESGTFHTLLETVGRERKKAAHLQDLIRREEEGRGKMKALQRQLLDIRKEKALELQKREEMIAHLKDQLQQMKAKTTLEKKYVKNSSELMVYQGQKFNAHKEKQLEDDIKHLQEKIKEEKRVHKEMEGFLKEHQTQLVQKLEMWMERYDTETDIKQKELNSLKTNKANNLAYFQELCKTYQESEQVVITDRLEKEEQRRLQEKEERERKAAVKIQAWWRGTCVRQGLGPYGKGTKGPKGSKGSKDKKTKEAKKEKKK